MTRQAWRECLKKLLRQAGMHLKNPVTLLVADVQSAPQFILDDIALIVNHTGISPASSLYSHSTSTIPSFHFNLHSTFKDIIGLWDADEVSAIVDDLRRGVDTLQV